MIKTKVQMEAIGKVISEVMEIAVHNGANSISMPDEYVVNIYLEAEKELAELLGWKELRKPAMQNKNWVGISPDDNPNSEFGYSPYVSLWCSDSAAAFDLMVEHNVNLTFAGDFGVSTYTDGDVEGKLFDYIDYQSKQDCVRYAIVQAVIAKLKGK